MNNAAQAVTAAVKELHLDEVVLIVHDLGGLTGFAGVAEVPERAAESYAVYTFAWSPAEFRFRAMLALLAKARQVVVPGGHHFPMCDYPALVATSISGWYRDVVAA
jgi:pimeloyl-ACP methyl ester carboxylesterase